MAACGGRSIQTLEEAPTTTQAIGGSTDAGIGSGDSGVTTGGTASFGSGGSVTGGAGGGSGVAGSMLGEATGGDGCVTADECPAPQGPCAYATCDQGACGVANVAKGALAMRDTPADCFDTACDGEGAETKVVDVANAPTADSACSFVSCSSAGSVEVTPVKAGADCSGPLGAKLCDGAGRCVLCLSSADCQTGETCAKNACVSASCSDGFKDHDETDIDCGGSCSPCPLTKDCAVDADCASGACDALLPHRCLADQCADHHANGTETDRDCGGSSCPKCGDDARCKIDGDCAAGVCDIARGPICLPARCLDGVLNGSESDLDCGGGICDGCALGKKCEIFYDCASQACDGLSRTCVADHCTDHNWDGDETYTDCGGSCAPCNLGGRCLTDGDCPPGHPCAKTTPHVCQ